MKKPAIIYSEKLKVSFGPHVFPTDKYWLLYARLKAEGLLDKVDIFEPKPATGQDISLAHLPDYTRDFMNFEYSEAIMTSEIPINEAIRDFFLLTTGGTILAARLSLERGRSLNIGGGWHHAFPDHAEGFCYLNDIAIAIRSLQESDMAQRFVVVDCDLHQGNGTAVCFARDERVFTFSIHQENLYPVKQKSDLDIGLPNFTGDQSYLDLLRKEVPKMFEAHRPDCVCYVAGADPYEDDQLGSLKITKEGLSTRDLLIIGEAVRRGIPIFVVLAGGYARKTGDVVDIHLNTIRVLIEG
ncbi:MAG TPA: histone deacetylase [Actinobacteria bacterium]|nr:histone deacetylase [Actinomycetota bacterium]